MVSHGSIYVPDRVNSNLWSQCRKGPSKFSNTTLNSLFGVVKMANFGLIWPNMDSGTFWRILLSKCSISSMATTASTSTSLWSTWVISPSNNLTTVFEKNLLDDGRIFNFEINILPTGVSSLCWMRSTKRGSALRPDRERRSPSMSTWHISLTRGNALVK